MSEFQLFLFCAIIYLIQLPAAFFCQNEYIDEDNDQPLADSFLNAIEGDGLKCGICNTEMNPECADPSSKSINTQICDKNKMSVCRIVEYFNARENRVHFSRACVEDKDPSNNDACSKARTAIFGPVRSCKFCSTDLCNINRGITVQKSKAQESFAAQQPGKKSENSSTALRSSLDILITITLFNLCRTLIVNILC